MTRIGSLCSGYGGLEMGVQAVIGGTVAWHVEYNADASRILAHHWPDVPNHGDLTSIDWSSVEPVEVITAGYPCQPFSHAGKRKGTKDVRHLWPYVAAAVRALRPRLVLLENVAGHVSLGLDVVLGDLSALGYDARWGCLRAAAVGAPHGRERVFIAAADTRRERHGGREDRRGVGRVDGEDAGEARQRQRAREVPVDRGAAAAADTEGHEQREPAIARPLRDEPRPGARDHAAPADAERSGWDGWALEPIRGPIRRASAAGRSEGHCGPDCALGWDWGIYTAAVRRWHDLTRCVPAPVQPSTRGGRDQLAPRFVEWMQGLPAGHVTDPAIWDGMKPSTARNAQLTALGNGVVPQQAAAAYALLIPDLTATEAVSA